MDLTGVRLVARDGAVHDVACHGLADRDAGLPWTVDTPTQIASVSKQVAAVVALALSEAVALDDPVATHLPAAPAQWRDVTVRHLLTHTSGIRHWDPGLAGFDPPTVRDPAERLQLLLDAPLLSRPGAVWRYSSPGYIVLAALLQDAVSRPYAELVRDLVITPLGLTGTTVGEPPGGGAARGYRGTEPVATWDLHTMSGTGDVWSTASDLAVLIDAVHTGRLLPSGAQTALYADPVPTGKPADGVFTTTHYGLGHFVGSVHGRAAYLHPGDNPGYLALAARLTDDGTTVVVVSNDETCDVENAVADAVRTDTA